MLADASILHNESTQDSPTARLLTAYLSMEQRSCFDPQAHLGIFPGCAHIEPPESACTGLDSGDSCTGATGFAVVAAARAARPLGTALLGCGIRGTMIGGAVLLFRFSEVTEDVCIGSQ